MFLRSLGWLFIAVACAFSTGCVADRQVPFDENAFRRYAGAGTGSVTGQAFVKTLGGDVKYGAGNRVMLVPETPWTTEDYTRAVLNNERLKPPTPEVAQTFVKYVRSTIADGSGNFEFHDLPPGEYFVECPILWQVGSGLYAQQTGGMAHAVADVTDGNVTKVVATGN